MRTMNGIEAQGNLFQTKDGNHAMDHTKENDLIELINTTQQKDLNYLDLSKRNIQDLPTQLLELTSLQVIFLGRIFYQFFLFSICI